MARKTCLDCGQPAERFGSMWLRCLPCSEIAARQRIASPSRVRRGHFKPRIEGGVRVCLDCSAPVARPYGKRGAIPLRCAPCGTSRHVLMSRARAAAGQAVKTAIKRGELQPAFERACADCAKPAALYDHRDYTRPLEVEPVCRSCNVMRGPALVWPSWVHSVFPAGYREAA